MRMSDYEHEHRKAPSLEAVAQLLSTMLYHKRFFPYYTFNVLAGTDSKGKGGVYVYDAIGSFERVPWAANGSGGHQVMSVLDSQVSFAPLPQVQQNKRTLSADLASNGLQRPECVNRQSSSSYAYYARFAKII